MSHIEKITGELRALTTGVDRAQTLASAADNQAQEVALRAAGAGFAAVAAGLTRIRDGIATVRGGLGSLATTIGEATKSTAAVPQEASPHETITGLTPVHHAVDGIRDTAAATIAQVGQTRQLVTTVLHGGQPGPLIQSLEQITQVLTLVVQRTATARQAVETAIAEARQLGSAGN
ncbi:hypothetical protein DER29_2724 [Micromonospora sp. M71_S20]|uniref:DUF6244 family protein n=1 Tax=Micromonospora sp. M71_S20 TaxID=592872 RepID=UPI000EB3BC27|nr:DUF6244 family protein [Micromonospora sp. M71_S20]RLK24788.1 hypothetical protein DER29_2724 [Micromonospora sp. M71_S20]